MQAENTFSVGVLGFPGAGDREQLVADIAASFGIASEDAARLVDSAPVVVKRGVAADSTKALVKQLLELGADVSVRNDATGAEKRYLQEQVAPTEQAEVAAEPTDREKAMSGAPPPLSGAAALAAAMLARGGGPPKAKSIPPPPDTGVAPDEIPPVTAPPVIGLETQKSLEMCGSCQRPVEQGEVCTRCGWHNAKKKRVCRSCKGELELTGIGAVPKGLIALAVLVGVAGAAGATFLGGPLLAPAPLIAAVAIVFFAAGARVDVRCSKCKTPVGIDRLQEKERVPYKLARVKLFAAGAALLLPPLGLPVVASYSAPVLEGSSFGIGWKLPVPRTHRDLYRETHPIRVPDGPMDTLSAMRAEPSYFGSTIYLLGSIRIAKVPAKGIDLETLLKEAGKSLFEGEASAIHDAQGKGKRTLEATVRGRYHGAPVVADLRATDFESDVAFIAVISKSGDPAPDDVAHVNDSLEVIRSKR